MSINTVEADIIIGIDLGLKTFAVISDGDDTEFVDKVNYIKASATTFKEVKYSNNFYKASTKVAKLQEHIANQRKDFAHKLSTRIANENQVVILEDLNIKGMVKNKRLAKAISDAGWQQFKTFLKYKLGWQGKHLIIIERWYASSKTCSACNEKNIALTLNDRAWICGTCGVVHERDENAAINIRNEGIRVLMTVAA